MTFRRLLLVAGFLLSSIAAFIGGAWAQQTQKIIWHWAKSMDATQAAPNIHKILFENGHIRLLDVTIPVGATEPMHGHFYPSAIVIDAVLPRISDHVLEPTGQDPVVTERRYVGDDWSTPECRALGQQGPHQTTNLDSFPLHFYRLEFKKLDGKSVESMTTYHD